MLIFCSINYWFSCQLSPWLKSIECDCQMLTRVTIQMKVALSESLSGIAFLETVSSKVTVKWLKGRLICVALAMTNSFQRKKTKLPNVLAHFFSFRRLLSVFYLLSQVTQLNVLPGKWSSSANEGHCGYEAQVNA